MADVKSFLDSWIEKNLQFAGDQRDETVTPEAEMLAESLVIEAEADGITREELEEEVGDLVAYLQGKLDAEVGA